MDLFENVKEREKIDYERNLRVVKNTEMVQKARYTLPPLEHKTLLYAISKVKQEDDINTEYSFELKDFFSVCGISDNYTLLKRTLKSVSDKSWWYKDEYGTEHLIRWFNTLKIEKGTGKVKFKFHEEMQRFIINLTYDNAYITQYELKTILPMHGIYSIRLFELLKSYANRSEWTFNIDDFKQLMDCEKYKNYNELKKRVIEPSVKEINRFSELVIHAHPIRKGKKVVKIRFIISSKTPQENIETDTDINQELDGQLMIDLLNGKIKQTEIEQQEQAEEIQFMEERSKLWAEENQKKRVRRNKTQE